MIDLYTAGTPNGYKVSIALEEMGLEYETHAIDLPKVSRSQRRFSLSIRTGVYLQ